MPEICVRGALTRELYFTTGESREYESKTCSFPSIVRIGHAIYVCSAGTIFIWIKKSASRPATAGTAAGATAPDSPE
jgi:hypothetical protein